MENVKFGEWVALYAAILSSVLALTGFIKWLLSGPRLSVTVFNPNETTLGKHHAFIAIVSNSGSVSTVVRKIEVSFRTSRWIWGKEIGDAQFGERSNWKPAVKLVPTDRPNVSRQEPNILLPGQELRAPAQVITKYEPCEHWIRVTAYARNKRRGFTGWAAPDSKDDNEVR